MQILNWIWNDEQLTALVLTRSRSGQDVILRLRVDELPVALRPQSLLTAWDALASTRRVDSELLYRLLLVLLNSQPETWQSLSLPDPGLKPAKPFKATAAHPRAYKGTRARQAKTSYPSIDLRPYLLDLARVRALLRSLNLYAPETLARLNREGFDLPDNFLERAGDPWLRGRFSQSDPLAGLPREIGLSLLPQLQSEAPAQVEALIRRISGWKNLERRLPTLIRLLGICGLKRLLYCLGELQAHGPGRVLPLLGFLAEDGPRMLRAEHLPAIALLLELCPQLHAAPRDWLRWALSESIDFDYLMAGLTLARRYHTHHRFPDRDRGKGFDLPAVEAVLTHCAAPDRHFHKGYQGLQLWQRWGQIEGLGKAFARIDWLSFSPELAESLLDWIKGEFVWGSSLNAHRYAELACLRAPQIARQLAELPATGQFKWLRLLYDAYETHASQNTFATATANRLLDRASALFSRLAAPPFEPSVLEAEPFVAWLDLLSDADFATFCALPERSLLALEALTEQRNQRWHVRRGLYALLPAAPGFALAALRDHPRRLLALCARLGLMPARKAIAARFAGSELLSERLTSLPLNKLLNLIQPLCMTHGLSSPFPRKLRDWQAGSIQLSPGQLERARERSLEQLSLTRLDWLEALCLESVFAPYPDAPRNENLRHALLFAGLTDQNRRGLRRCLQQLLTGHADYLLNHPLNQRWLTRHPACRQPAWIGHLDHVDPFDNLSDVSDQASSEVVYTCRWQDQDLELRLERDPFEVLKMGTYVSSCLSLGGSFMHAAVAALLDVNKQVVYARHAGRVVARQLLGVTESDELLGFWVYPQGTPEGLALHFLAFARLLARQLGLPLYAKDDYAYELPTLLALDWYDDGAWNLGQLRRRAKKQAGALAAQSGLTVRAQVRA